MKGRKDKSKLTPKKVMITRNGKTFETTVYVGGDKDKGKHTNVKVKHLKNTLHAQLTNASNGGMRLSKSDSRKKMMAIGKGLPTKHLLMEAKRCNILTEEEKNEDITRMRVMMKMREKLEKGEPIIYHKKHLDYFDYVMKTGHGKMRIVDLRNRDRENSIIEDFSGLKRISRDDLNNVSPLETKLLDFIEAEGISLEVYGENYAEERDENNMALTFNGMGGVVLFMTEDFLNREDGDDSRLVTLAHELGHYCDLKFNAGDDADIFDLGMEMAQEMIAWHYGADLLHAIGFNNFDRVGVEQHDALYTYAFYDGVLLEECVDKQDKILDNHVKKLANARKKRGIDV